MAAGRFTRQGRAFRHFCTTPGQPKEVLKSDENHAPAEQNALLRMARGEPKGVETTVNHVKNALVESLCTAFLERSKCAQSIVPADRNAPLEATFF